MTENRSPQAWLYLRLSRDHSGAADSLEAQEQKLRQRADAEGLKVTQVFSEGAGKSAYGGKARPVWESLIASVEPGVIVLAVETSRFSRDTADGLTQLRTITDAGAHVVTLDGNDTRQDGNALPLTVRLAVAQEESKNKSDRIKRRKADQRSKGLWTNKPPYGHTRGDDGKLELDPITSPVLRRICDEAMQGSGAVAIAAGLNTDGITGPRGGLWNQMTIAALLRSPVLCGWMPALGDKTTHAVVDGAPVLCVSGPTVLSVAERQRMRKAVSARSPELHAGKRVGGRPSGALLRGMLRCGRCGVVMTVNGYQYVCTTQRAGKVCSPVGGLTGTMSIVDDAASTKVLAHLAALDPADPDDLAKLGRVASMWSPPADTDARAEAMAERDATQERLAALEHAHFVDGSVPADRFATLSAALAERVSKLDAAMDGMGEAIDITPLLDLVESVQAWNSASVVTRRTLVEAVVESFTLTPAPKRGSRFSVDRLQAAWR